MRLDIIGCTGSMSGPESPASCYLVRSNTTAILLDLGPGAAGRVLRYMDLDDLDAVCFSHLHVDHCGDLGSLQVYRKWGPNRDRGPLPLYGPAGIQQRLFGIDGFPEDGETYVTEFDFREFPGAEYPEVATQLWQPDTDCETEAIQVGDLQVTAIPVWHTIPAVALRIVGPGVDGGEVTLAYSGDADDCPGLRVALAGADLALLECAFPESETVRGIHLVPQRAAEVLRDTSPTRTLITHLQPWQDGDQLVSQIRAATNGVAVERAMPAQSVEI